MTIKQASIFLNGKIVKAREELIESLTPGIVCGQGVFETMRVYRGKIFALDQHFQRLFRGLKRLKIRSPYTQAQWEKYLYQTIKRNGLSQARIRLAVWKEHKRIHIAIVCQSRKVQKNNKLFTATISTVKRNKTLFSDIKSLDYDCFRKAFEEARQKGFDEGVLLNNRREIVEGSRTNIFFVKKGVLYTPQIKTGCLNGITRQIIIKEAQQSGIICRSVCVGVRALVRADEAFLTNSLIGIVPLIKIDQHRIGNGSIGAITKKLLHAYNTRIHSCSALGKSV